MLRVLLGGYLDVDPGSLAFARLTSGKPVLEGSVARGSADPDFSVSHSGDLALIAFSRAGAVGVDVELVSRRLDPARLAAKALGAREAQRIEQLGAEQGRREVLRGWTRREALQKMSFPSPGDPADALRLIRLDVGDRAIASLAIAGGSTAPIYLNYRGPARRGPRSGALCR